jgi:uncharacterized membrane protein YfcA
MDSSPLLLLALATFAIALLYSSVGHAGASGYIAVLSLAGLAPETIRPTALMLNVLVASIAFWHFWRAGHFSWRLFWPFALLSVPLAYLGGTVTLPVHVFKVVVGIALLVSATHFLVRRFPDEQRAPPSLPVALSAGAGLGLLAGLTGTGGGIFLTPLLLWRRWGRTRNVAAVSALFILVNSVAGLAGNVRSQGLPGVDIAMAVGLAAMAGGTIGSHLGSRRLPVTAIRTLLAIVLAVAGAKLTLLS